MKQWIVLLVAGLFVTAAWAEDKPATVMPAEVTLTTGRVLRNVKVVRWEKDRVVLKHSGGADPIAFSLIKSPTRADLESIRAVEMEAAGKKVEQAKRDQADAAKVAAAPRKYEGQAFIVTKGAGNYKLGATIVRMYYKPVSEVREIFRSSSTAPQADEIATTDADGKFSFMAPASGPITIVARAKRLVGANVNHDYEKYLWIVSVDEMANRFEPRLDNSNMERGYIVESGAYLSL